MRHFRTLGTLVEIGAVVCALVLTLLARPPAFGWTVFGTILAETPGRQARLMLR